ncbi:MAG TPA: tetratricopeptide repeat protein [Chthoniobacter sp.]|jgi:Flp pilus assembly protein TadD
MPPVAQTFQLALRHHQAGQLSQAESLYRQILAVQPNHAGALHFLGLLAHQAGHRILAEQLIGRSIALEPNDPDAHCNLGEVYRATGRLDEAVASYRRALALDPNHPEASDNLGIALAEQGQFAEAITAHQRALQLKPDLASAHNNLGTALVEVGCIEEATASFRRALERNPDYSDARFNYSLVLLLQGEYERAWPFYEARADDPSWPKRNFSVPRWNGGPIEGRRILVHAEQGFGDSIQFVRYARLLAARGAQVILESPSTLAKLLSEASGVGETVIAGEPLPAFDLHVPMLSLPMLFQTTPETIPRETPYLFPNKALTETWARRLGERLGERSPRLRVGLAWAGRPENARLRKRHIDFATLRPLLEVNGVDFISLQIDQAPAAIQQFPNPSQWIDITAEIHDFADTAALLAHLDLVISVDTAVAHLAGALGYLVWTLLPFVPDWRWGLNSETSAWYPTMRLFRQPFLGDWDSVLQRVAAELTQLAARDAAQRASGGSRFF